MRTVNWAGGETIIWQAHQHLRSHCRSGNQIRNPDPRLLVKFLHALKIIKFRLPSARESQGEEGNCSEYADCRVPFESDLYHESTHSASEREYYAISIPSHFQALDGTVAPGRSEQETCLICPSERGLSWRQKTEDWRRKQVAHKPVLSSHDGPCCGVPMVWQ